MFYKEMLEKIEDMVILQKDPSEIIACIGELKDHDDALRSNALDLAGIMSDDLTTTLVSFVNQCVDKGVRVKASDIAIRRDYRNDTGVSDEFKDILSKLKSDGSVGQHHFTISNGLWLVDNTVDLSKGTIEQVLYLQGLDYAFDKLIGLRPFYMTEHVIKTLLDKTTK